MPWIIARFHGYSPAEYGPLSDSSGEIKTPKKMEKFPLQRFMYLFTYLFIFPQHMYLHSLWVHINHTVEQKYHGAERYQGKKKIKSATR